ncbi:MAG: hypothetical protein KDD55_00940 [Bdellovibrionales bacterium]|nr:hypothetical protein [Bdellovibrionales bacterium]
MLPLRASGECLLEGICVAWIIALVQFRLFFLIVFSVIFFGCQELAFAADQYDADTQYYEIPASETTTGYPEPYVVVRPVPLPPTPVPLLIIFHSYGGSHESFLTETDFVNTAVRQRGWMILSMLGGHPFHRGGLMSQIHTDLVLEHMQASDGDSIDFSRIYGVGFSVGGGAVLNYAARHLNFSGWRFAALVSASANLSIAHSYYEEPHSQLEYVHPLVMGGNPSEVPFHYQQYSVLEATNPSISESFSLDPETYPSIESDLSLAHNLSNIPLFLLHENSSSIPGLYHLYAQTFGLYSFLLPFGKANYEERSDINNHSWWVIDSEVACEFLENHSFEMPLGGRYLIDRTMKLFSFDVERGSEERFSAFTFYRYPTVNELQLLEVRNIQSLRVELDSLDLTATLPLSLLFLFQDETINEVRIFGYSAAPQEVLLNGTIANGLWEWVEDENAILLSPQLGFQKWTIHPGGTL